MRRRWISGGVAASVALVAGCTAHATPTPTSTVPVAILAASQPWQHGALGEPSVWKKHGRWQMFYSAGWDVAGIGYATAPKASGPWTDHGRVIGSGAGGWSGQAARNSALIDRRVIVYFTKPLGSKVYAATGTPMHLHVVGAVLSGRPVVNTSVIRDGRHYRMLFEQNIDSPAHWAMGYAEATSPFGPFTVRAFPLRSLQVGDGAFGGPDLHKTHDGYEALYHAARHGTLPTDIYRATSRDLIHWSTPHMVVEHAGGFYDQAADPSEADGVLFYSVADNTHGKGYAAMRTP